MSIREDRRFGLKNQQQVMPFIEKHLGISLTENHNYHEMDFCNNEKTIYVELKSRRVTHNQYPTALIGKNKIDFCNQDLQKEYYFFWKYEDGIYYLKYNKTIWDTFKVELYQRNKRIDVVDNPSDTIHVPHKYLIKLMI